MNTDVVQKLWGFCNTLRHDGVNYGDYIEQLTYLLFLKLADEKGLPQIEGLEQPYKVVSKAPPVVSRLRLFGQAVAPHIEGENVKRV